MEMGTIFWDIQNGNGNYILGRREYVAIFNCNNETSHKNFGDKKGAHVLGENKREYLATNVNVASNMKLPKMGNVASNQKPRK